MTDPESKEQRATHTPGPWHADSVMGDDPHEICVTNPREGAGNPEVIATVFCDPGKQGMISLAEANANARVIAAAPEMLDTLRKAADTFRDLGMVLRMLQKTITAEACQIAEDASRAVIAKAEGRT